MARVKEFDRRAALQAAIVTFAARGYEGTSTDDLLRAMRIGRQSMYDTFGDKRQLYLEALRTHASDSVAATLQLLAAAWPAWRCGPSLPGERPRPASCRGHER